MQYNRVAVPLAVISDLHQRWVPPRCGAALTRLRKQSFFVDLRPAEWSTSADLECHQQSHHCDLQATSRREKNCVWIWHVASSRANIILLASIVKGVETPELWQLGSVWDARRSESRVGSSRPGRWGRALETWSRLQWNVAPAFHKPDRHTQLFQTNSVLYFSKHGSRGLLVRITHTSNDRPITDL